MSADCEIPGSRLCQLDGSKAMGMPASHPALSGRSGHFCFDKRNFDLPSTFKPRSQVVCVCWGGAEEAVAPLGETLKKRKEKEKRSALD